MNSASDSPSERMILVELSTISGTTEAILIWGAMIIAIEAVTEIITESKVFEGLRTRLSGLPGKLGWYLGGLSECGYCLSVWTSIPASLVLPGRIIAGEHLALVISDIIVKVFILHRFSNIWHKVVWRWTEMIPFVLFLSPREEVSLPGQEDKLEESREHEHDQRVS